MNNISYSYINKDFKNEGFRILYQLETTQYDVDVKIDYSNLHKVEVNTIEEALYFINAWQKAGYENIHMTTSIMQNDITIIEDSSDEIVIEGNQRIIKTLSEQRKVNEQLEKYYEQSNAFLAQYKALERFQQFCITDYSNSN